MNKSLKEWEKISVVSQQKGESCFSIRKVFGVPLCRIWSICITRQLVPQVHELSALGLKIGWFCLFLGSEFFEEGNENIFKPCLNFLFLFKQGTMCSFLQYYYFHKIELLSLAGYSLMISFLRILPRTLLHRVWFADSYCFTNKYWDGG